MNAIRSSSLMGAMILSGAFGWSATAIAQGKPAQPQSPAAAPAGSGETAPPAADKPASGNPSLDDLLGIGGEPKQGEKAKPEAGAKPQADDAAAKEHEKALKDELSDAQVADAFTQAVDKMAISARLLDTQFDAGVGTQRVQEDIIAKLNALLDAARKKPSNSKSSSSSSSSNPSPSSNPSSNPTAAKQNNKAMNPGDKRNDKPQDSQEGDPPPFQQGDTNVVLEETRAEWGSLPQRVRDMLLQGRKDKFSAIYQQMTQEYYKRLAEEGTP